MDLLIRVRDNAMIGMYLVQADGLVIITTPEANKWLYEHAKKNNFMCLRCQALTRQSELDNEGVCKEGCRLETPEFQKILDAPKETRMVRIGVAASEMMEQFMAASTSPEYDFPDDSSFPGALY